MKRIAYLFSLLLFLCSCDGHHEPEIILSEMDGVRIGDIMYADGTMGHPEDYTASSPSPVAVVYYINHNDSIDGRGYAVYVKEDSGQMWNYQGESQGTSADTVLHDGSANTWAIESSAFIETVKWNDTITVVTPDGVLKDSIITYEVNLPHYSPVVMRLTDVWACGQRAYIPSAAQIRCLQGNIDKVNETLELVGGDLLQTTAPDCWYWTSTEVQSMESQYVWLFSMVTCEIQESRKTQIHNIRPIITINYPR